MDGAPVLAPAPPTHTRTRALNLLSCFRLTRLFGAMVGRDRWAHSEIDHHSSLVKTHSHNPNTEPLPPVHSRHMNKHAHGTHRSSTRLFPSRPVLTRPSICSPFEWAIYGVMSLSLTLGMCAITHFVCPCASGGGVPEMKVRGVF